MSVKIFIWNKDEGWSDQQAWKACQKETFIEPWNTASGKPKSGDEVFLMKTGDKPRGFVAHGKITDKPMWRGAHHKPDEAQKGKKENFIEIEFDQFQSFEHEPILPKESLEWAYPQKVWTIQSSGQELSEEEGTVLKNMWKSFLDWMQGSRNIILYGPPGTGKTYSTVLYAAAIISGRSVDELKGLPYDEVLEKYKKWKDEGLIAFTTFHQSYGYEEFIEGIRPQTEAKTGAIRYDIVAGVFKAFCERAQAQPNHAFVFIIDEINRGNISKIFGELITLIEDSKRAGRPEAMEVTLPYSGNSFSVPQNVYILGTMNTADRSIALIDTALRRRFSFVEMMPDAGVLRDLGAAEVTQGDKTLNVATMLETMNRRIEFLYDREHTIGHAFFVGLKDHPDITHLAAIFKNKVIPLLQEYFYDDYHKIQLVLGDNAKKDEKFKFIKNTRMEPEEVFQPSEGLNNEYEAKTRYAINTGDKDNKGAFDCIESYLQIYTTQTQSSTGQGTAADAATGAAKDEAK